MNQEEEDIMEEAGVVENLKQDTLVTVIQQSGDCTNLNCFLDMCPLYCWCGRSDDDNKKKLDRATKEFIKRWGRNELLA